jgi:ubiquinone/menaquinone biosynthesis C-methylase UbiE
MIDASAPPIEPGNFRKMDSTMLAVPMIAPDRAPEPRHAHSNRRWIALARRVARLLREQGGSGPLVTRSYDRLASGYDRAWTGHMRDLSVELLDRLAPGPECRSIDLTCGTGFLTAELARRTGAETVGVDASAGMLSVARANFPGCRFEQADVLEWLRAQPAASAGAIACGWGLGYSRPLAVVRECARVLRPGGRLGIIDNSLFSLAEIVWTSMRTFAERPEALAHAMQVRFLPGAFALRAAMRLSGLRVRASWSGARTYRVESGAAAIARLRETGAAAGFELAAEPEAAEEIYARFAELLERRYGGPAGIPVTHRFLAAVGEKR